MAARTHDFDLGALRLSSGEGRHLELEVPVEPLELGGEQYRAEPAEPAEPAGPAAGGIPVVLDISRMMGGGYALRLRFDAMLSGPCMRCLKRAQPLVDVDAREVDRPGEGEELESPYVKDEQLDVASWARDAFALALPSKVLCREDCAGLCPVCAADLNEAGPKHHHESAPDPRWAKLRELELE
ncbi:MAG TPA: DUF177 domain-containing protein [Solirubrobacteraceae bacterium]|nr:DUF177 domain-containing protein [Solirubrobacteraceae bacterium]